MLAFSQYPVAKVRSLQGQLQLAVADCTSLDQASQRLAELIFTEIAGAVLVRVYAILALKLLPLPNRLWVEELARAKGITRALKPATPVLSLLGTRGLELAWNDRRSSQGHIGIPLVSAEFTDSIPMVAALLSDLGVSMGPQSADGMQRDGLLGGEATGIFYVEDAATTVDARARKIIPAQDFVAAYGVKTVFGMGGAWANGEAVACIVFGRKFLARNVARRVAPLLSVFRAATNTLAVSGRHFEEQR